MFIAPLQMPEAMASLGSKKIWKHLIYQFLKNCLLTQQTCLRYFLLASKKHSLSKTTFIYTHVTDKYLRKIISPLDHLY